MKSHLYLFHILLLNCTTPKNDEGSAGAIYMDTAKTKIKLDSFESTNDPVMTGETKSDLEFQLIRFDTVDFDTLFATDVIYNDAFAISPFGLRHEGLRKHIPYDSIVSGKYDLNEVKRKSQLNSNWEYHFIELRTKHSLLIFMKTVEGYIGFDRGVVFDSTIKLDFGIEVGISKKEFLNVFGADTIKGDIIHVNDQDQGYEHLFLFKNDTLKAIKLSNIFL